MTPDPKDKVIEELVKAFKPFAKEAERWGDAPDHFEIGIHLHECPHKGWAGVARFKVSDLHKARKADAAAARLKDEP